MTTTQTNPVLAREVAAAQMSAVEHPAAHAWFVRNINTYRTFTIGANGVCTRGILPREVKRFPDIAGKKAVFRWVNDAVECLRFEMV